MKKKSKARLLTLKALTAWLEAQDSEAQYDYNSNDDCLVCRFLKSEGIASPRAGGHYWRENIDSNKQFEFSNGIAGIASAYPHSYGAALKRARELAR